MDGDCGHGHVFCVSRCLVAPAKDVSKVYRVTGIVVRVVYNILYLTDVYYVDNILLLHLPVAGTVLYITTKHVSSKRID